MKQSDKSPKCVMKNNIILLIFLDTSYVLFCAALQLVHIKEKYKVQ